jgi:S-layer homology domain.
MKKRVLLTLAIAMSVTAVAAANSFADVPANHWAYDAVSKLSSAGIVDGYGDNSYRGDRTMTRYEMAQTIARAMASSEKADAAVKAELDKLSVEFAKELKSLGVRVTALENHSTNVKFSGDMRIRYQTSENGVWSGQNDQDSRFRLQAEGKVNDNWSVVGRFEAEDNLRSPAENRSDVVMDKMYVQGNYGDFGVRIGRMDIMPAYGIVFDDFMDGVEVSWNKDKFYGALRYGNLNSAFTGKYWLQTPSWRTDLDLAHGDMYMAEVAVKDVVKGLNIRGAYTHFEDMVFEGERWSIPAGPTPIGYDREVEGNGGVWEAGADYTLGNSGIKLTGAVADTTGALTTGNGGEMAWFGQVDYKGAKKEVVGSWGAFVGYRDFRDSNAILITTFNVDGKGWYVGGSYALAKNIMLKAWYEDMKNDWTPSVGNKDNVNDYFRVQAEFFF